MSNDKTLIITPRQMGKELAEDAKGHTRYARIDKGGVYNYLIVKVGDTFIAVDDDYLKIDFESVRPITDTEKHRNGLYVLKDQTRMLYHGQKGRKAKVDHWIVPVNFGEMLGYEEPISSDPYFLLVKRSESGMPDFVKTPQGTPAELKMGIGLLISDSPEFYKFSKKPQDIDAKLTGGYFPGVLRQEDIVNRDRSLKEKHREFETFSVIELETALKGFTAEFEKRFPHLARLYPYSRHFMFEEYDFHEDKF